MNDKEPLTERLADQLRELIVRGELRPNQRLVESDLATSLSVSRTPVREALAKLVAERLVTSDRRGWLVREHTGQEVNEIYEVRTALEGYAAALAAVRRTGEELMAIEEAIAYESRLPTSAQNERYEVNERMHDLIVRAAHNATMYDEILRNKRFYFSYRLGHMYTEAELQTVRAQHRAIVDAIARSNAVSAERAAREHMVTDWQSARARLLLPGLAESPNLPLPLTLTK